MKRIINTSVLLAAAAMAMMSCAKNEIEVPETSDGFVYTFNLSKEVSKAVVGDDSIEYEAGDALGVFAGTTVNSSSVVDVTTDPVTVSITLSESLSEGAKLYAYYPYSTDNASAQASAVTLSIPSEQNQVGSVYDADAMPMVSLPYEAETGLASGETVGNLYMCNLGAVAEFRVYGEDFSGEEINSVTFTSKNAVAGNFTFDLTAVDGEGTLAIKGNEIKTVSTKVTELTVGSDVANAAKVYMVLAPGEHNGTLAVSTANATYTFDVSTAVAFNRSMVRPVSLNLANAERIATTFGLFVANGYDPTKYEPLEIIFTDYAYYNSSENNDRYNRMQSIKNVPEGTTTQNRFVATPVYVQSEIPVGSVIVVLPEYKYRPDAWTNLNTKTTSRPAEVSTSVVQVDEDWWSSWGFRAFNISLTIKGDLNETTAQRAHESFAIYVPKNTTDYSSEFESLLTDAGYSLSDYEMLDLSLTTSAYYNSSSDFGDLIMYAKNSRQFVASRIFTKDDLPNGSLLAVKSGYQYRPDGWTDLNVLTTTRPENVTASVTVVDDAWWGDWNYRGFNLSKTSWTGSSYTADDHEGIRKSFAIFVPKN